MMSNSSVSSVQGYINNVKWLEMPLSKAYRISLAYANSMPNKVDRLGVNMSNPRAVINKWIDDKRKEVALMLDKVTTATSCYELLAQSLLEAV